MKNQENPKNCPEVFLSLINRAEKELLTGQDIEPVFFIGWNTGEKILTVELATLLTANKKALESLGREIPDDAGLLENTLQAFPSIVKDHKADYVISISSAWAVDVETGTTLSRPVHEYGSKKEILLARFESYVDGVFTYIAEIKTSSDLKNKKIVKRTWETTGQATGKIANLLPLRAIDLH